MVRKIELKLIDDELSRQLSFAKRRNGLIKKALELFMVCGVDCIFISFSPSGRLSYFSGDKRIEDVLARFATVPEHLRNFHLSELELQQLIATLKELKEQTEEYIENDRTIHAVQQEILQVKEEIQYVKAEIRRYQPLIKTMMTVTESNTSELFLKEALLKVQDRKKELIGYHNDIDASPPSNSMVGVENSSTNPSDEVHHQSNEDSNKNEDNTIMPNQSIISEGRRQRRSMETSLICQAGTSFTSLLLSADVSDESFSPITESLPVLPHQDNDDCFQQNQFNVFLDGVLNTHFYSNGNGNGNTSESSERNESRNEAQNSNSNSNNNDMMNSPHFQMPLPPMELHSNFASLSFPFLGNPTFQWNNNPTPLGERGGFQDLLNSVAGLNMSAILSPPNMLINHQSMDDHNNNNMNHSIPQNMQGAVVNSALQEVQGNLISGSPGILETGGGPSSPVQKRKLPWDDDIYLRLSNAHSGNSESSIAPPTSSVSRNLAYNTAYEIMGLPIDPHFRMFQEMRRKGAGKQQQENT